MQMLITSTSSYSFSKEVNDKLEQGAKVVPGTLICSITNAATNFGECYKNPKFEEMERWAVVLELPRTLPEP